MPKELEEDPVGVDRQQGNRNDERHQITVVVVGPQVLNKVVVAAIEQLHEEDSEYREHEQQAGHNQRDHADDLSDFVAVLVEFSAFLVLAVGVHTAGVVLELGLRLAPKDGLLQRGYRLQLLGGRGAAQFWSEGLALVSKLLALHALLTLDLG